jgi:exosortase/archaeosortase family protein
MRPLLSYSGVPYLPNQGEGPPQTPGQPRPFIFYVLVYFVVFSSLQIVWSGARGTPLERFWVDTLTVKPAVVLINAFTPKVGAVSYGTSIKAAGGGLNILNGCDGTDMLFLLTAAFVCCPLSWALRLRGLGTSVMIVLAFNQARILALFYAFRADKTLFDLLHTTVAPVVLIALATLFFYACVNRSLRTLAPTT